jgi:hypothetical protein
VLARRFENAAVMTRDPADARKACAARGKGKREGLGGKRGASEEEARDLRGKPLKEVRGRGGRGGVVM